MEEGIIYAAIILFTLVAAILLKKRDGAKTTANNPGRDEAAPNIPQSKDPPPEYDNAVLLAILREQLNYSREDVSTLQEEVEKLTAQVLSIRNDVLFFLANNSKETKIDIGRLEIELGKINNRLDNYRIILSRIEEHTR